MVACRAWSALAALIAASGGAAPVQAGEVWAAAGGGSTLELRGSYKALGAGLRLPRGLVAATDALSSSDPAVTALPLFGGYSAQTARAWGRLLLQDRVELEAGWQVGMVLASDPALAGGALPGGSLAATAASGASRRLLDFDRALAEREGFLLAHDLDLLAVKVHGSLGDLTVGRQVLSWGSGRLWNPTDLLSPFGPAELDREVRPGVDAVRASLPLAATAQLEALWLPQPDARDQGGVVHARVNLWGFDLSPSIAKYGRDVVAGLDTVGDLGPVAVHAELAWTSALDAAVEGTPRRFLRAVAGTDWRPTAHVLLTGEYHFNGWGAASPAGYMAVLRSGRVARGEVFGAGRHYAGLVVGWQATELLTVQGIAIANLADPSAVVVPALEYWAEQTVLVRVSGAAPIGRPPDPEAADAGTLGLRSEFGASPWSLSVQVAVYTP